MSSETDAQRLAEIGARCERATEGPWVVEEFYSTSTIHSPSGPPVVGGGSVYGDAGVLRRDDADFIARTREDVPWLLAQLEQLACTDASWQATESRLAHIGQLLGVDYTCEEPETCEQVIERMKADIKESKGKLDIIVREGAGEPPDSLAADYGGTGWEKSKEVVAVRMERGKAAKSTHAEIKRIKKDAGQLAAMREVLRSQWKREPLVEKWQTMGPFGKEREYRRCTACGTDSPGLFARHKHSETCPWLLCQEALASSTNELPKEVLTTDAGRPEADVIAAATRFEEADRQFMELDRNNPWFGHYREIVIDERIKAMKDICEAVVHLRDGTNKVAGSHECDDCDGSGQFFIDGKPQVCICVGEKGGGE